MDVDGIPVAQMRQAGSSIPSRPERRVLPDASHQVCRGAKGKKRGLPEICRTKMPFSSVRWVLRCTPLQLEAPWLLVGCNKLGLTLLG
jgi:hypothetical protein